MVSNEVHQYYRYKKDAERLAKQERGRAKQRRG